MNFRILIAGIISILPIFGADRVAAQQFQIPVDSEFNESQISFTGGTSPPYYFIWDMRLVDGNIAICGAGHLRVNQLRSVVQDILRGSTMNVSGREIPVDLRFFTSVRSQRALRSATATCQLVAPFSGGNVSFRLGSGSFRN